MIKTYRDKSGHLTDGIGRPIWDKDCEICQREDTQDGAILAFPKKCPKHGVVHRNGGYKSCGIN